MQRRPIRSTSLKAVGYEPSSLTLEIEYRNGRAVRYTGVSEAVYQGLLAVPGKAQFVEQVLEKSGYGREQLR
ncbi:KTSC domain-containing protein [Hymenobacter elongatus]|uniref:KTSC domain-containing protein n=1 Tax=Hymenobacter elongatus TaxID=877208 RepID=A0A4Z0PQ41_9BACT|nr:KTSC domain-containing protein [Hymenobacter elongatus]TGE18350.1 KTSC domain-containing protein [Hymenobacter elongatus]